MRSTRLTIGALVLVAMALSLSGFAGAVTENMSPGETVTEYLVADEGDWIDYSWSSTQAVVFVLRDPDNVELDSGTSTSDFGLITADMDGTYTLTWTNNQLSAVTLTYEIDSIPFGNGEGFFEDVWTTVLIFLVAIVVIIVVIVVLVVYVLGKDKKKAAAQNVPPMMAGPPGMPLTNCPRCGVPLDSQGSFCQKCGARVR